MSIKVKVGTAAEDARPDIKLTIKEKNTKEYNLHLRKALNGDLMIFDHTDIDIIVIWRWMGKDKECIEAKMIHSFGIAPC